MCTSAGWFRVDVMDFVVTLRMWRTLVKVAVGRSGMCGLSVVDVSWESLPSTCDDTGVKENHKIGGQASQLHCYAVSLPRMQFLA